MEANPFPALTIYYMGLSPKVANYTEKRSILDFINEYTRFYQ